MIELQHFILSIALIISLILLSVSGILLFIRLLIGPSLPDRVVSLDVIAILVACVVGIIAIIARQPLYLDIIIAIALISFIGTVAFAQLVEWQLGKHKKGGNHDK